MEGKMIGVYIMGNDNMTLYTGITNNLIRRIREHKEGKQKGFTKKYNIKKCLYYEFHEYIFHAIIREKQIKNMRRQEKLTLIKSKNPLFADLASEIFSYVENPLDILTYHERRKQNEKYFHVDSRMI
jgi:putative endonuclease